MAPTHSSSLPSWLARTPLVLLAIILAVGPACDADETSTPDTPDWTGLSPDDYDGNILIPEARTGTSFTLTAGEDTHDFGTGPVSTRSYDDHGVLGPTLFIEQGDTVTIDIQNDLTDETTVHWHGIHLPAAMDGGPHSTFAAGTSFQASWTVSNEAATMWYHPHPHGATATQVSQGLGGFLIVQDPVESALALPRTYGVDDLCLAVQDKNIQGSTINTAALGNTITVNGAANAYREVPAQMVRLRLLNASIERNYYLGFHDNRSFQLIGVDGGMLAAPVTTTRTLIGPAERVELLVDMAAVGTGNSVTLCSFASEMTSQGLVGGTNGGPAGPNAGVDFDLIRFDVVEQNDAPVTTAPTTLVPRTVPWTEAQADATRTIRLTGGGMGNPFTIDGQSFDMMRIDHRVTLDNIEVWSIVNETNVNHLFHIHDIVFYLLDRTGRADDTVANWASGRPEETGPKDTVLVLPGETVRFITQFTTYADSVVPFMYHCHMLPHEDGGMMGQFLVEVAP